MSDANVQRVEWSIVRPVRGFLSDAPRRWDRYRLDVQPGFVSIHWYLRRMALEIVAARRLDEPDRHREHRNDIMSDSP